MTYRGVGSGTGQEEFVGNVTQPDNDFASGDIPLSQEFFDLFDAGSVLHLPIVLGAISFFHSVPTAQLSLTPCVLAKIFLREITEWTDPEILELNPDLDLPDGYAITVARRVLGSSSTYSITAYLNTACPDIWPETLVGSTIEWPADTSECEGSGAMTDCIVNVEGTIGYIDSGHGHSENLQEIELRNFDNVYISSKEAGERGGVAIVVDSAGIPDSLDESFVNVTYLNKVCSPFSARFARCMYRYHLQRPDQVFPVYIAWSRYVAHCCHVVHLRPQGFDLHAESCLADSSQGFLAGVVFR